MITQKLYQKVPIKYTWNYLRQGWDDALAQYKYLGEEETQNNIFIEY